jgi:hypothetical protein
MKKSVKKRPSDPNMRMHSIMQDVIFATSKPIKAPARKKRGKLIRLSKPCLHCHFLRDADA